MESLYNDIETNSLTSAESTKAALTYLKLKS